MEKKIFFSFFFTDFKRKKKIKKFILENKHFFKKMFETKIRHLEIIKFIITFLDGEIFFLVKLKSKRDFYFLIVFILLFIGNDLI